MENKYNLSEETIEVLRYLVRKMRENRNHVGTAYDDTLTYSDGMVAHQIGLESIICQDLLEFEDDIKETNFYKEKTKYETKTGQ